MTEPQTSLTAEELQPGHLYRVEFEDCYTAGHFVGVFQQVMDPQRGYDFAVFDCGQIGLAHPEQLAITEVLPPKEDV